MHGFTSHRCSSAPAVRNHVVRQEPCKGIPDMDRHLLLYQHSGHVVAAGRLAGPHGLGRTNRRVEADTGTVLQHWYNVGKVDRWSTAGPFLRMFLAMGRTWLYRGMKEGKRRRSRACVQYLKDIFGCDLDALLTAAGHNLLDPLGASSAYAF